MLICACCYDSLGEENVVGFRARGRSIRDGSTRSRVLLNCVLLHMTRLSNSSWVPSLLNKKGASLKSAIAEVEGRGRRIEHKELSLTSVGL